VIVFAIVAAVMVASALLALLPPLLVRRKAETSDRAGANIALLRRALEDNDAELRGGAIARDQWEQNRRELERRAIEESQAADSAKPAPARAEQSPWVALTIAVLLPLVALPLYIALGEPRALTGTATLAEEQPAGHTTQIAQVTEMAEKLAQRLKDTPDDAEGWVMLGRTYAFVGRHPEALEAFEKAIKLRPKDAALLADYADIWAMTRGGGNLNGEPEKLIKGALELDPDQPKALALAGTLAFRRQDYATAARHWERAVSVLPADSEFAKQIATGLAEARQAMGGGQATGGAQPGSAGAPSKKMETAEAEPAKSGKAAPAGPSISGTVTLAPALAQKAGADDSLFVFAHAPEGGGPPLAVFRARVGDLPLKFKLDDSMSMSPQFRLSTAAKVVVTARVSKSGAAAPQPGDLEGASAPVAPGATGVAVRIDKTR